MFTGLVEQIGVLQRRGGGKLVIKPQKAISDPQTGESIAVNGCCLSLEEVSRSGELVFHTLDESLARTNLSYLTPGSYVNLERAMASHSRFGGHIVQGHVDGTGRILDFRQLSCGDWELVVSLPEELAPEVVHKGSIAIDGVSLTVARLEADRFAVRLIPLTLQDTALSQRKVNDPVNLESDIIGKYVRRQLELINRPVNTASSGSVTMEKLQEAGFF